MSRLYIRTRLRLLFAPKNENILYPPWLNEDLEKRVGVRDRWQNLSHAPISPVAVRPEAYEALAGSFWDNLFEVYDPGVTRIPVEVRHSRYREKSQEVCRAPECFAPGRKKARELLRGGLRNFLQGGASIHPF